MEKSSEEKEFESNKKRARKPSPIYDEEPTFRYPQFLGFILIIGFLIIGSAAGVYSTLQELMETPCLGCLGLYPSFEIEFTFSTVDGKPHPDWVLDALEDGPVFIEFTQNDEVCKPCARMRPKVEALERDYNDIVTFFIINTWEKEFREVFKGDENIKPITKEEILDAYRPYDVENFGGGDGWATPTFVIVTLEKDDDGKIKPYFGTGYGEFKDNDAQKTKEELIDILDFAIKRHHHNEDLYEKQEG
jgi:thiol-disulfide isomerase/thioredoxin